MSESEEQREVRLGVVRKCDNFHAMIAHRAEQFEEFAKTVAALVDLSAAAANVAAAYRRLYAELDAMPSKYKTLLDDVKSGKVEWTPDSPSE